MTDWLDLDTAKAYINYTKLTGQDDAALELELDFAQRKVEELCGPVLTATVTAEIVDGSGYVLALAYRPASLTSLATYPGGSALTVTDYRADGQTIRRKDDGWITGPLQVTYTTGAASAPSWAKLAALEILRQRWITRRSPARGQQVAEGFLVSRQAEAAMADHLLAPDGFA